MRAPVLLDTNVASFLIGQRPQRALYDGDLRGRRGLLPLQVVAELRFGADLRNWGARRRRDLSDFLREYQVLFPTAETAETWAHLKAATLRLGVTIETADLWIAATAITSGLTLVAHDTIFRSVVGLKLICYAPE